MQESATLAVDECLTQSQTRGPSRPLLNLTAGDLLDRTATRFPDRDAVVAWVRLAPNQSATEEEIRAFCRDQIAYFKIPEHIRFVTEFPATLSGKIQKYKMRAFETEARSLESVAAAVTA